VKDIETQQRFVMLRSQGWSFNRIAQELNVARNTLINWSRKFQFEIANHRAIELEALREKLLATRETRAQALAEQLRRVEQELQKRDLAKVSTSRLFTMADALRRQIGRETGELRFTCPINDIPRDEYHEQVQTWSP
jgi:transposase